MLKLKCLFIVGVLLVFILPNLIGQEYQEFIFTKGDNNISTITMGSANSPHCTVIEYQDFLVLHEVPYIPNSITTNDSTKMEMVSTNPLIAFVDSIYLHKPIKYILNSHHHGHSLSTVVPFFERGAKLITAKENVQIYEKRGLFENDKNTDYSESIIEISGDTTILVDTNMPIDLLYLKKADYKSIPTESYLFFYFPKQKLLATSCMVYLRDIDDKYGFKGIVYSDRLVNVKEIIQDKHIDVEGTLQLYKFRSDGGERKLPYFSMDFHKNVHEHSWHRLKLSEHFQSMSYEFLTTKRDSLLDYLIESDIYHIVINHAIYELIEKKEYQKAVALAQILVTYEPDRINEIDTLGEAYYNNGQIKVAKHYDQIIQSSKQNTEGLGLIEWEKNQKNRLEKSS